LLRATELDERQVRRRPLAVVRLVLRLFSLLWLKVSGGKIELFFADG
jgi:hypothetical protein